MSWNITVKVEGGKPEITTFFTPADGTYAMGGHDDEMQASVWVNAPGINSNASAQKKKEPVSG